MTAEWVTSDLYIVAGVVLVLVLLVLLVLCWLSGHNSRRDVVEIQFSTGRPGSTLTIRTKQDHADELLHHLLDQVFLMEQGEPGTGGEPEGEPDPKEQTELEVKAELEEVQLSEICFNPDSLDRSLTD